MANITKKLIRYNYSSRNKTPLVYIVIHDTGNSCAGADAEAHYRYFNGGNRGASAHYFVDDQVIIQTVEDYNASWHCGDGQGKYGITNQNSIGIEICINADGDYEKAVANALDLTHFLMEKYSIPTSRVVRHFDASRKVCPKTMSADNWARWWEFKKVLIERAEEELRKALTVLQLNGLMDSPKYWFQNAWEGKIIKGEYAAILIKRTATFIQKLESIKGIATSLLKDTYLKR
ncbi:MAG: N-acetylmuramoyl-L-alanine amidase [Firmicutes bacterium]|nr:N-acetylmuramoyl-L-alanine amidase [Bacillota bacterium]